MQITFVINTAEQEELERLRACVHRLREAEHEVRARVTFEEGDAWRFAREAADAGANLVIAAGGDGTINEVANGLHEHRGAGGGGRTRLAVVPLGTGNDLASALGVPMAIEDAVDTALRGRAVEVDVARVSGRCFLNVSTGGFGAEATDEAPPEIKRALGSLAYLVSGARKFIGLEAAGGRITAGTQCFEGRFLLFAVGNSRRTGGGNWLTPHADLHDGLLDLCIVKEMTRMEFFRLLPELRAGRHVDHPAVIYLQAPEIRVEPLSELSVNVDGEPLGPSDCYQYLISPHRLTMMIPA